MLNSFMWLVVTMLNSTENLLYEKVQRCDSLYHQEPNQLINKSVLSIYPVLHIVSRW